MGGLESGTTEEEDGVGPQKTESGETPVVGSNEVLRLGIDVVLDHCPGTRPRQGVTWVERGTSVRRARRGERGGTRKRK